MLHQQARLDRDDGSKKSHHGLGPVALDQAARHQAPAIDQHEEDQLERQGHDHRRQHHHAHRHQHRCHHEVDDQERQEQEEADLEGALELRDHEGGHQDAQRHLLGARRLGLMRKLSEQRQVLLADVLLHEGAQRPGGTLDGLLDADLVVHERPDAGLVGALQRRSHHEAGEEQRQRNDHRIGRRGGGPERGTQQREHHHDAREGRHHDQDRRRERQHRQERDQLDDALGEALTLAEIDADILRDGGGSRRKEKNRYTAHHRRETNAAGGYRCPQVFPFGRPNKLAISCSRLS